MQIDRNKSFKGNDLGVTQRSFTIKLRNRNEEDGAPPPPSGTGGGSAASRNSGGGSTATGNTGGGGASGEITPQDWDIAAQILGGN